MANNSARRIKSVSYSKYGYMFILPFFIVYFIFQLYPLVYTFWLSTQLKSNIVDVATGIMIPKGPEFIGLDNFKSLIDNGTLLSSFKNTFIMWGCNFVPQMLLALLLAEWFTNIRLKVKGMGAFKVLIYLPNVITAASIAVLFTSLFDYPKAPINNMLIEMGVLSKPFEFFRSVGWTRGIVSFIQTWMWYGNTMIVLIAGILGINPSLFEAASIDGATSFETFIHVTIPEIQPIMLYTLVTSLIGGLQLYDVPKLLNRGNPNGTTRTVTMYITDLAFGSAQDYGLSSAASIVLFIVTAALSILLFYIMRDRDESARKKYNKKQRKLAKQGAKMGGGLGI